MSKTAKATTAKSLSTLSSFPSHACATWPCLNLCKRRNQVKVKVVLTHLYEDGPALLPVDNDVRDAGGYKTVDAPAGPNEGVVVHNAVTNGGGQHLNFKNM